MGVKPLLLFMMAGACVAPAATYHIDCASGDDARSGATPATAWKTLNKANSTALHAGDRLLLKGGCRWTGALELKGRGAEDNPIVVDRYGEGEKPRIDGAGQPAALRLDDVAFMEVSGLEITNDAPTPGLRRGVLIVLSEGSGAARHVWLRGLRVHDVRGKLGAELAEKATGGIGVEARGKVSPARFEDLRIENCTVEHVDSTGIYTWSEAMPHPRDPRWDELHWKRVVIRGNRLNDIGKNAMIIRAALAPVIERNVVTSAAARLHGNAMFVFGCKNALMQYNEVSGTKFHDLEGAAFDSDYNSEGTVIQYNYARDNGGGLVNICSNPGSGKGRGYNDGTIVRYNINEGGRNRVIAFDGPATNTRIYHNTVYVGAGLAPNIVEFDVFGQTRGYAAKTWIANNVFYNAGNSRYVAGEATEVTFEANCFAGNRWHNEPEDAKKISADPLIQNVGSGVRGYRLGAGSPCARSGVPVSGSVVLDYFGNLVATGHPDRGAVQSTVTAEYVPDVVFATAGGVELVADLYLPKGAGPFPAAVYLHGGGWTSGDRKQLQRQAADAATRGVLGMAIEYRLAPKWKYPAALDDSRTAVRWLKANAAKYRIDSRRIAAVGSSAGGHLACLLGLTGDAQDRVMAVVAFNPVLDLTDLRGDSANLVKFLGAPCKDSMDLCREASPQTHFRKGAPPFLILHGTKDESVPYRQAEKAAATLTQAGATVKLFTAPDAGHTFYMSPRWFAPTLQVFEDFLATQVAAGR